MHRISLILLAATVAATTVASSAVASVDYHSSRSNEPPSAHFVNDPVPCGGGGECLTGAFGSACTSNADCGGAICGVRSPDTTSEGGMAACSGFQTYDELAGGLSNGWHFGPKYKAKLKMKAKHGDVSVQLKLKDIEDAAGVPSEEAGQLVLLVSQRWQDRIGGDMTLVPMPIAFSVPLSKGKGKLKASFNQAFGALGLPNLPTSEFVIMKTRLIDPNGNRFGAVGFSLD